MNLTLLEVSLDDAKINANAPFSGKNDAGSDDRDVADDESGASSIEVETGSVESEDSEGGGPGSIVGFVVAVAVLLVIAALVRRRRSKGGSDEESIEVE